MGCCESIRGHEHHHANGNPAFRSPFPKGILERAEKAPALARAVVSIRAMGENPSAAFERDVMAIGRLIQAAKKEGHVNECLHTTKELARDISKALAGRMEYAERLWQDGAIALNSISKPDCLADTGARREIERKLLYSILTLKIAEKVYGALGKPYEWEARKASDSASWKLAEFELAGKKFGVATEFKLFEEAARINGWLNVRPLLETGCLSEFQRDVLTSFDALEKEFGTLGMVREK